VGPIWPQTAVRGFQVGRGERCEWSARRVVAADFDAIGEHSFLDLHSSQGASMLQDVIAQI
jgi:hypothetical protein